MEAIRINEKDSGKTNYYVRTSEEYVEVSCRDGEVEEVRDYEKQLHEEETNVFNEKKKIENKNSENSVFISSESEIPENVVSAVKEYC